MLGTIIFLSLLILFLSLMLCIDVTIKLDVNHNSLIISIRVYKIKILTIDIDVMGFNFRINKNKKRKPLSLILPKEQEYLIKQIKSSILDKLYYDKINFISFINLSDSATTSNLVGGFNVICSFLTIVFYYKNKDIEFYYTNTASFVDRNNYINIDIRVYFTIFDMVFATIMSFYKRGRYVKQKK